MLKNRRLDNHGRPLSGLPLDEAAKPTAYGEKKLVVSSIMYNRAGTKYRGNPEKEPTIQECSPQLHPRGKSGMSVNYGDCTLTPGASGSGALGRVNGTMMVQGIFTSEPLWGNGMMAPNGVPFSLDPSRPNYSYGFSFYPEDVIKMNEFVEKQGGVLAR
jgi:hypothetical protein